MADRNDDYGRNSQARREGNDRSDSGREQQEHRQHRGDWMGEQERYGNRGDRHDERQYTQRGDFGGQRGEYGQNEFERNRNDYPERNQYGNRNNDQDWQRNSGQDRQTSGNRDWQSNGNRDWQNQSNQRWENEGGQPSQQQRGMSPHQGRVSWEREGSGHTGLFGTGQQGFGTGYRSGEMSSSYSTGAGYTGHSGSGPESYSGGAGMYNDRGRHSGKGPKGYQRSDDRIREDVCERLTQHSEIDASEIDVKVNNGEVTLSGTVDQRQCKRMSEDIAESVSGVREVNNQIRVRDREMAGAQQPTSSSNSGSKESPGGQRK